MSGNNPKDTGAFTRRSFFKASAASGLLLAAPYIITSKKSGFIPQAYAMMPGEGVGGEEGGNLNTSPPTTPFVEPMPLPVIPKPVAALSPAPDTTKFQRYSQFPAKEYYELNVAESLHSFHPSLPLNRVWTYNGVSPGPNFRARYGSPMIVRIKNNLPTISTGFGDPNIITHLHNAHTGSESDGYPGDFYGPGKYKDHHYCHMLAGGDPNEALGSLWYHDHRLDFTAANTYKGLVGTFFLYDALDSGNELDPNPQALRLPSGEYDLPIFLADKRFNANGTLVFSQTDLNGFIGDRFTVNGKIQPFFKVARRKYRFRFYNGGPARWYGVKLSTGQSFQMIASDGNLLPAPITLTRFEHAPAERFDIVVDFSKNKIGDQIFLQNDIAHVNGRGPAGILATPIQLMRFDVDRDAADPSVVPAALRPLPKMLPTVRTRMWEFSNEGGAWTVNGRLFDLNRVDAVCRQGQPEIWNLSGGAGPEWSHPIHLHMEEFRIISRGDRAVSPEERGRKDVVKLGTSESASIYVNFRDMQGKYVMHCHNTVHEDHAMMVRYDVIP